MTSHELAAKLLSVPATEVGFLVYTGGDDEFKEVQQAMLIDGVVHLKPYKYVEAWEKDKVL